MGEVPMLQLFSTHRHSASSPSDLDHRAMGDSPLSPLPSPPDLEAALSGDTHNGRNYKSKAVLLPRTRSMTAGFFLDAISDEEPRHFLDACALCKKLLGSNRDIYMYRGDTPFCSEECRQEQIEMDEAMEKSRKVASLKKASSPIRDQEKSSAPSPPRERAAHIRASTVVAG